jgi:glycopeptide antibiotics resistance protein
MKARSVLALAAGAYLLFVIYGSLVPLHFVRVPWNEALARFAAIPWFELGIASRADWVANLLLFIPLAWLWLGVLWRRGRVAWNVLAGLLVAATGAALSVGIEFTQIFFPPRTVSINDIVAETLGAVLGVGLWAWTGPAVWRWLEGWAEARGSAGWAERVLHVYLAVFCLYSVLPLDLTISPVEIYRKWDSGMVQLVPFSTPYASFADALYDMGADVLIWVPVAVLWRLPGRLTALEVVLRVICAAILVETMQFFVYSRVTATTDILTATAGGIVGVLLGGRLARASAAPAGRHGQAPAWGIWALAFAAWLAVVVLVFWYPFEVRMDGGFVAPRLQQLWRVPFEAY